MLTQKHKRVLLKLSGEMLLGSQPFGIDQTALLDLAQAIHNFKKNTNLQIGIVIGGGNIFRGISLAGDAIERTPADQMGMLATIMNGIALQQAFEKIGASTSLLSALECPKAAETYTWYKALHYLDAGHLVIFVGGTGNPYFTTDTAAAMRAGEIGADMLLKATKVDGVYNKDPMVHADATKYTSLSYSQMLAEKLAVMDATAVALCRSNRIPLFVFNMERLKEVNNASILTRPELGTMITGD